METQARPPRSDAGRAARFVNFIVIEASIFLVP